MLTQERALQAFDYNPVTGKLFWKVFTSRRVKVGQEAGSLNTSGAAKGYISVRIDTKLYLAHRVIWLMVHGEWPEQDTDHLDLNRSNNKLSNLRTASRAQNMWNRPKLSGNTSGVKGVFRSKTTGNFIASTRCNGKKIHIGVYKTIEEAHKAWIAAVTTYHGSFVHIDTPLIYPTFEDWIKRPRKRRKDAKPINVSLKDNL